MARSQGEPSCRDLSGQDLNKDFGPGDSSARLTPTRCEHCLRCRAPWHWSGDTAFALGGVFCPGGILLLALLLGEHTSWRAVGLAVRPDRTLSGSGADLPRRYKPLLHPPVTPQLCLPDVYHDRPDRDPPLEIAIVAWGESSCSLSQASHSE